VLGLFVGAKVLACLVWPVGDPRCIEGIVNGRGMGTHDQVTMTVMLLSRQIFVSSRMGS